MPDQHLVMPGSIDSHCHTGPMTEKGIPTNKLLTDLHDAGLRAVIDVGIAPDDLEERRTRMASFEWVALTSGLHPSQATRPDRPALMDLLSSQITASQIVAVGEIGLDYHWDSGDRAVAIELFDNQVALAVQANLPVIVHNREADPDVLAILRRHRPRGIMHCFSQSPDFCRKCLDLGLYISFGGNITYKGSDLIRESAAMVPLEQLLVETDSPYLSPVPVRGRPNHPGHLGFTITALAQLGSHDPAAVARMTAANAIGLFGL
jgi:TatD DNase family protein